MTVTTDRELPSRTTWSGVAVNVSDRPSSEGPVNGGADCLSTPQPDTPVAMAASRSARRTPERMELTVNIPGYLRGIREVAKSDTDRSGHRQLIPGLIVAVERHLGDCGDEGLSGPQCRQRCFQLGHVPDDVEAGARRAVSRNRDGDRGIERARHVHAFRVAPVRPP